MYKSLQKKRKKNQLYFSHIRAVWVNFPRTFQTMNLYLLFALNHFESLQVVQAGGPHVSLSSSLYMFDFVIHRFSNIDFLK